MPGFSIFYDSSFFRDSFMSVYFTQASVTMTTVRCGQSVILPSSHLKTSTARSFLFNQS